MDVRRLTAITLKGDTFYPNEQKGIIQRRGRVSEKKKILTTVCK